MSLPLPRTVADVGPGGPLVTSLGGINALHNDMILRQMNQIRSQYLPKTLQAEAASKLAYAQLLGPQFVAKLLGNDAAVANLGSDRAKAALNAVANAGMGVTGGGNAINQTPTYNGVGQPSTNQKTASLWDRLTHAFTQKPSQPKTNALNESPRPYGAEPSIANENPYEHRPKNGVQLEGAQWYDKNGNPVYEEEIEQPGKPSINLELNRGQTEPTYAENTGKYKGTIKQGEEAGKYRAQAQEEIGNSQLALSNSGAVLDRMTGIITNPVFANMRNRIPAFQSKQLDYLKAMGTPEEKELIGDFLSTGESFIASTVQGFSGKPLVREFDLAQRQKITPHDTVDSAIGKLRSARALHDIAEKKNQVVSELLEKGYNEADAVKQANKMVDVKAIEKETNERLQRKIEIRNSKTGEKKMVTLEEARKLGVPNV